MKYITKILLSILAFSQVVIAEEGITITPKGRFDFTLGAMDHKAKDFRRVSAHRDNFAFLSTASFTINATNRLSEDMAYGVQMALATSSRSDRKIQSHLFFESAAGKWELGSDKSAANKMKITGSSNASATGGAWDMWVKADIRDYSIQYITNTGSFVDTKMRDWKNSEYARKITYYTPEIYGFQGGISYIPDSTNIGENSYNNPVYHMYNGMTGYKFDIKDAFGWGVTKVFKAQNGVSTKLSLVGETGKVVPKFLTRHEALAIPAATRPIEVPNAKFKKLKTYTIGGEVKYEAFAISGCYGNYMQSFTSEQVDVPGRTKSDLYNIGAKYSFEKFSMSTQYLHTNNKKNILDAVTFAVDYKLAPGLLPYAEITSYKASGWYKNAGTLNQIKTDTHKGLLLLTGIRLEF